MFWSLRRISPRTEQKETFWLRIQIFYGPIDNQTLRNFIMSWFDVCTQLFDSLSASHSNIAFNRIIASTFSFLLSIFSFLFDVLQLSKFFFFFIEPQLICLFVLYNLNFSLMAWKQKQVSPRRHYGSKRVRSERERRENVSILDREDLEYLISQRRGAAKVLIADSCLSDCNRMQSLRES